MAKYRGTRYNRPSLGGNETRSCKCEFSHATIDLRLELVSDRSRVWQRHGSKNICWLQLSNRIKQPKTTFAIYDGLQRRTNTTLLANKSRGRNFRQFRFTNTQLKITPANNSHFETNNDLLAVIPQRLHPPYLREGQNFHLRDYPARPPASQRFPDADADVYDVELPGLEKSCPNGPWHRTTLSGRQVIEFSSDGTRLQKKQCSLVHGSASSQRHYKRIHVHFICLYPNSKRCYILKVTRSLNGLPMDAVRVLVNLNENISKWIPKLVIYVRTRYRQCRNTYPRYPRYRTQQIKLRGINTQMRKPTEKHLPKGLESQVIPGFIEILHDDHPKKWLL